jgi:hypothetical protein
MVAHTLSSGCNGEGIPEDGCATNGCPDGQVCDSNDECIPGCEGDDDCALDETCVLLVEGDRICEQCEDVLVTECNEDLDCPGAEICVHCRCGLFFDAGPGEGEGEGEDAGPGEGEGEGDAGPDPVDGGVDAGGEGEGEAETVPGCGPDDTPVGTVACGSIAESFDLLVPSDTNEQNIASKKEDSNSGNFTARVSPVNTCTETDLTGLTLQPGFDVPMSCGNGGEAQVFSSEAPFGGGASKLQSTVLNPGGTVGATTDIITGSTDRLDPQDVSRSGGVGVARLRTADSVFAFDPAAGPYDFSGGLPTGNAGIIPLGTADTDRAQLSGDGLFVTLDTPDALVGGDVNGFRDVYFAPVEANPTWIQVTDSAGGDSTDPSANFDGSRIFFISEATNVVNGDDNAARDLFLFDRDPDGNGTFEDNAVTTRVVEAGSGQVNTDMPSTTGSGRYVAFSASGDGITADVNDTHPSQIFVHDTLNDVTALVSKADNGDPSNGSCRLPTLSPGATFVVFRCGGDNLPGATGFQTIFAAPNPLVGN